MPEPKSRARFDPASFWLGGLVFGVAIMVGNWIWQAFV
ncbi:hypothetical protein SEA_VALENTINIPUFF_50 [Microbacterium phage ValentiniPuff]|uniref:Uncharacterized protein n=1 Tax=Microbacterium phage ValentiniPuff TaxID=2315705 RepID=A0A386KQV7_9CAUD|nr:hypothetical protein SEA_VALENTINIPUFF_50 [Microbacterium phage ValentiniPuff]